MVRECILTIGLVIGSTPHFSDLIQRLQKSSNDESFSFHEQLRTDQLPPEYVACELATPEDVIAELSERVVHILGPDALREDSTRQGLKEFYESLGNNTFYHCTGEGVAANDPNLATVRDIYIGEHTRYNFEIEVSGED